MREQSTIYINPTFHEEVTFVPEKKHRVNRFKTRHVVPEYIDDFSISGDEHDLTLTELEWVNKYLGGLNSSALPIFKFMQEHRTEKFIIADLGCGSGDILKRIHEVCKAANQKVKLVGMDANIHALHYAIKHHFRTEDVALMYADVLNEPENIIPADIYTLNLFLHHFSFEEIQKLLEHLAEKQPKLIVINDLRRSRLAYGLFMLLSKLKRTSHVSLHDGLLSITKGFNRKEMLEIAEMMSGYTYAIHRKWAFRWQLVLKRA
jgi:SAM-dependent methyltransferase